LAKKERNRDRELSLAIQHLSHLPIHQFDVSKRTCGCGIGIPKVKKIKQKVVFFLFEIPALAKLYKRVSRELLI
jgi:hypothetical protein